MGHDQNSTLWVVKYRWLLHFFASKNPITALWFVIPLLFFWFNKIDFKNTPILASALMLIFGVLSWTLLEYLIHRFVFHWRPKNITVRNAMESIHLYHHRNVNDQEVITSGPVSAFFWSALNFGILYLFTKNLSQSSLIMFGLTLSYYAYEWVHYLVHHKNFTSGFMKYLQDYHLLHHERWAGNYGQTSPLWDILLGTSLTIQKIEVEKKKKYIFPYQIKKMPRTRSVTTI